MILLKKRWQKCENLHHITKCQHWYTTDIDTLLHSCESWKYTAIRRWPTLAGPIFSSLQLTSFLQLVSSLLVKKLPPLPKSQSLLFLSKKSIQNWQLSSLTSRIWFSVMCRLVMPLFYEDKPKSNIEDKTQPEAKSGKVKYPNVILVLALFFFSLSCGIESIFQSQSFTFALCGPHNLSPKQACIFLQMQLQSSASLLQTTY